MPLTLSQTVSPTDEPISLDQIKRHLRITIDNDDILLFGLIQTARHHLELVTRRQFLTATWIYALDAFPSETQIQLPRPPLQLIDSLTYFDSNNVETVFATTQYGVDILSEPGRIYLLPGNRWPATYAIPNAVRITFTAGWTSAEQVPASLKSLLYLFVGHLYENREATTSGDLMHEIPLGVQSLMWINRIPKVF